MNVTRIPHLVAHRGFLKRFPENTWRGLEAALRAGASWLEFDIQLCGDGEFVLLHDDNFTRTASVNQSVFDLDSTQIDISVHEPQRFGRQFEPTPVVTLVEVLQNLSIYPDVRAMVELKQESIHHWGLQTVMQKLAPLLASHQPQCILISFNHEVLSWCRCHYREIPIGWVLDRYDADRLAQAEALRPDFLICNDQEIPAGQTLWDGNWQWMLYDIVDPEKAIEWAARGVDLVETADIGSMLRDTKLKQGSVDHDL